MDVMNDQADFRDLVEANEQWVIATLRAVTVEEALRESVRRKDEFLAMLGHELRNPLAAIRNAASFSMPRMERTSPSGFTVYWFVRWVT